MLRYTKAKNFFGDDDMDFTKQLPDTTDFRELIDNNCIYVDKTAIINQFASKKGPFRKPRLRSV